MNKKYAMEKSLLGVAITDELHTDIGGAAVSLMDTNEETGHDYIRSGLVIRTAASGGGTLLTDGVDYVLGNENTVLSAEVSVALETTVQCYKTVQITNVTYQSGALYFSGFYHGDAVSAARENKNKQIVISKSADYTIDNSVYGDLVIAATSGAAGIRFKTPSAVLCKNKKIKVKKVDTGTGAVTILNDFSQTYQGVSYIFLFDQWDAIEMVSDGVQWLLSGTLTLQTGGINTNDFTNRELGDAVIPYDNAAGTALVIGEKVTNGTTPANTGIIVAKTATTLTLKKSTGTGIHADNNVLTGSMGGGTVLVNIPGSTSKNADGNVYHGFGAYATKMKISYWVYAGTTYQQAGARLIGNAALDSTGNLNRGYSVIDVDQNNLKIQTGATDGGEYMADNGVLDDIEANDYSYNIITTITF
jgi:hypothetical protein